jgi:FkbM family methyltransferase
MTSRSITVRGEKREVLIREGTTDVEIFDQVFTQRKYDLRRLGRINDLAQFLGRKKQETGKLPLVIDAGGYTGLSAMFFADHIPDSVVLTIEPEPGNYALLVQNVDRTYVQPIQAAVSSAPGRMRVVDPGRGHVWYRTERSDDVDPNTVGCLTINDIYTQTESRCFPFLVKVDIEGAEADLFAANTEWVAKTPLIIVELHDWLFPKTANSRAFLQCVSRDNRDFVYVLTEEVYSISNDLL